MKGHCVYSFCLLWSVLLFSPFTLCAASNYTILGLEKLHITEREKIAQWIEFASAATEKTLGRYPFDVQIHINLRKAAEPVPWANTRREPSQAIYFYVDPGFSKQQFIRDWTAYHEMSHLALPFLGQQGRWFAEGFASFMQYQIMLKSEVLKGPALQHYRYKLSPHVDFFRSDDSPLVVLTRLFENRNYKPAYWGSAWYFVLVDHYLQQQNLTVAGLISQYLRCCRHKDGSIDDVIASLDSLTQGAVFSAVLRQFQQSTAREVYALMP